MHIACAAILQRSPCQKPQKNEASIFNRNGASTIRKMSYEHDGFRTAVAMKNMIVEPLRFIESSLERQKSVHRTRMPI